MDHSKPIVSVVIPAYNHEAFIGDAIDSVLHQTYRPIELVVVDDGSTDGTWQRIKSIQQAKGESFRAYTKPNEGVSATLNFAIRQSKGSFVAPLASDDRFVPDKIERQIRLFSKSNPDVALVHSSAFYQYRDGQIVCNHGSYQPAIGHCLKEVVSLTRGVVAPSVMFKREAYERVGGFDQTMIAEDVDFYAALAAEGYAFAYDPEPLVYKRVTESNLGAQVSKWFNVHHRTLAKHADHFTPAERLAISARIYRSVGRTAAAAGETRLAFYAFHCAARDTRRPTPYAEFLLSVTRSLVLGRMPIGLRQALRSTRASHYKRNASHESKTPATANSVREADDR